jgi:disulfide bond formation protein DsbB
VPSVRVATDFFTVLTVLANVVVAIAIVLGIGAAFSRTVRDTIVSIAGFVGVQGALLAAWIVAVVTTAGSLYYSLHAHFIPCELCWYQRIAMYPLVVVLGVGWIRRDHRAWITAAPFVVVGAPLSLYHWLVERVPAFAESSSCSVVAPCTAPYFEKYGFITLAWMCLSSFLLIGTLLVLSVVAQRRAPELEEAADTVDRESATDAVEEPVP